MLAGGAGGNHVQQGVGRPPLPIVAEGPVEILPGALAQGPFLQARPWTYLPMGHQPPQGVPGLQAALQTRPSRPTTKTSMKSGLRLTHVMKAP